MSWLQRLYMQIKMVDFEDEDAPEDEDQNAPENQESIWAQPVTFGGAHAVAVVFKVLAWLVIVGGVITAASVGGDHSYTGNKGVTVVTIIAMTAFTAAAVAFFGYVLDLLLDIRRNTASGHIPSTVEGQRAMES